VPRQDRASSFSRQKHGPHVAAIVKIVEDPRQLRIHLPGERVEFLRPVETNLDQAFAVIQLQNMVGAVNGIAISVLAIGMLSHQAVPVGLGGRCEKRRSKTDSAMRFFIISSEPPAIIHPRERRKQYSTSDSCE
jgi:hypothetical protein